MTTPGMPHGTMRSKPRRSVVTLSANPWNVTHCFTWMPMLAILRPAVHTPVSPGCRSAAEPERAQRGDERRLELAQVPVQVLPVLPEVEDRVADELARAVVGHVPAALDLGHLDPAPLELGRRERQAGRPGAAAQGDHRLVLDQQQEVVPALAGHALPAERALQLEHLARRAAGPRSTTSSRALMRAYRGPASAAGQQRATRAAATPRRADEPRPAGELVDGDAEQHGDDGREGAHDAEPAAAVGRQDAARAAARRRRRPSTRPASVPKNSR